jgi:hypothetical protein
MSTTTNEESGFVVLRKRSDRRTCFSTAKEQVLRCAQDDSLRSLIPRPSSIYRGGVDSPEGPAAGPRKASLKASRARPNASLTPVRAEEALPL